MEGKSKRRFWPMFRLTFRWCRILVLFSAFLAVSLVVILNQGGLPSFLRSTIVRELEQRGVFLDYQNFRLGLNGSVIADKVQVSTSESSESPRIGFDRLEVKLSGTDLLHGRFTVNGLSVRKGRLDWRLSPNGEAPRLFALSNVVANLRFLSGDRWEIDQLDGSALGIRIRLNASLTNASALALRSQSVSQDPTGRPAGRGMETTRRWLDQVQTLAGQAALSSATEVRVMVEGDASDPRTFSGRLSVQSDGGKMTNLVWKDLLLTAKWNVKESPSAFPSNHVELHFGSIGGDWGRGEDVRVSAMLRTTNGVAGFHGAAWTATARELQVFGNQIELLEAAGDSELAGTNRNYFNSSIEVKTAHLRTAQLEATGLGVRIKGGHGLSLDDLIRAEIEGEAGQLSGVMGSLLKSKLALKVEGRPRTGRKPDPSWAYWAPLESWKLGGQIEAAGLKSEKIEAAECRIGFDWTAPMLELTHLDAKLYGGSVSARARLSVTDRSARASAKADFDLHRISHLLTTNSQRWISQFAWKTPPKVEGEAGVVFPAWTNKHPAWKEEVLPTVWLAARVQGTDASFKGIDVQRGSAEVGLSNLVWRIPKIEVFRPEGKATLGYEGHMLTQYYHWIIQSSVDPKIVRPLLDVPQQKVLDLFELPKPPVISGDVWGCWNAREKSAVDVRIDARDLAIRGCAFQEVGTRLVWTNQIVSFLQSKVVRIADESATLDSVVYDVGERMVTIEGGRGRLDAMVVAPVLGDRVPDALAPYRFEKPPDIVAHGHFAVGQMEKTEIVFDIQGEGFSWWRLKSPKVAGRLTWRGNDVIITGLKASFAQGTLEGDARFKVLPDKGADFSFESRFRDLSLNPLVAELTLGTNKLGGLLNGTLNITSGQTLDQATWTGFGTAELRDGFLWDIPLFGLFSPVLNAIVPGMGSARLHGGVATYRVSNRQVHTDDLEIHSPAMRLQYRGDVDFDGKVNATAHAEILRDAWAVGRVFSFALLPLTKLLEYRVTGTLAVPKSEPLYIPRFLTYPLRPFRTLKEMLPDDASRQVPAEKQKESP